MLGTRFRRTAILASILQKQPPMSGRLELPEGFGSHLYSRPYGQVVVQSEDRSAGGSEDLPSEVEELESEGSNSLEAEEPRFLSRSLPAWGSRLDLEVRQ